MDDDGTMPIEKHHRNFDAFMEEVIAGTHFKGDVKHVPGSKRRQLSRLGCSRLPTIEPIAGTREDFYEAKLVTSLNWYCPSLPTTIDEGGKQYVEWTFQWDPPNEELKFTR